MVQPKSFFFAWSHLIYFLKINSLIFPYSKQYCKNVKNWWQEISKGCRIKQEYSYTLLFIFEDMLSHPNSWACYFKDVYSHEVVIYPIKTFRIIITHLYKWLTFFNDHIINFFRELSSHLIFEWRINNLISYIIHLFLNHLFLGISLFFFNLFQSIFYF